MSEMKKNLGVACLVLAIAAWVWLVPNNNTFKESHTSEAEAVITSIGTGCGSSYSVVKYGYSVGGSRFENWTCYSSAQLAKADFAVGKPARACFNPSKPEDSSVIPLDYRCGRRARK